MALDEWIGAVTDPDSWRHLFGSDESPVVVAALDPRTTEVCLTLRAMFYGRPVRLFVVGPPGSGKALLVAALLAEAAEHGVAIRTLSSTTESEPLLKDLASGKIELLAVNGIDELTQGVRSAVLQHRAQCSFGLLATAEQLSVTTESALNDETDVIANIPRLEERPADVVAISQLLWPGLCGAQSDLISNCHEDAMHSLCRGPHPTGVSSLRAALAQLADSLISSGSMQGGLFRREVEAHDIDAAVFAAYREEYVAPESITAAAVIFVEGSTDVTYLQAAAECAERAWGWRLLQGCELRAAGQDRSGGAKAVWQRLIEMRATSSECVGLIDNDSVGRREYDTARGQALPVEQLPAEFDRLGLDQEERSVEVEDLLGLAILDRFFAAHSDVDPEEVRWRNGAWRVVPRGNDKALVADWVGREMGIEDCERLVYLLCVLRKRLGLSVPREDLDGWRTDLARSDQHVVSAVMARIGFDIGDAHSRDGSTATAFARIREALGRVGVRRRPR